VFVTGRPAASLYAVTRSFCACSATASAAWIVPLTVGAPVIDVPGETPRFPLIVVAPVFVTVVPASTPKDPAVPSPTVAGIAANAVDPDASIPIMSVIAMLLARSSLPP
jgi:hypothetical protein